MFITTPALIWKYETKQSLKRTNCVNVGLTNTISAGFILPAEKTMALLGVPTGNMKAWQQLKVTGIIR